MTNKEFNKQIYNKLKELSATLTTVEYSSLPKVYIDIKNRIDKSLIDLERGKLITPAIKEKTIKKVIYLRVSKKELNEKTQLPVILKNFKISRYDCLILSDKLSGYKIKSQEKRDGMNKLIELVESNQITDIYIYSLERLYRNITWLLEFYFKCARNNIKIHSYLQSEINQFEGDKPINTFLRYQSVLVNGFMGEQESYLISERTKKSFTVNEEGVRVSYKGNKAGRKSDLDSDDIKIIIKMSNEKKSLRKIQKVIQDRGKRVGLTTISNMNNKK